MKNDSQFQPAKLLTIGGSDSGGAAGIQADLKTWTALAVYGMSVVTAVTAQNSMQVTAVHYSPPDLVTAQIDAVLSDYGAQALKTGFIGKTDLIKVISSGIQEYKPAHVVIDPVLVNHQSQPMFLPGVVEAYRTHLLPLAGLVTPNWAEALLLSRVPASALPHQENILEVINRLHALGARHILITGVHRDGLVIDTYSNGSQHQQLPRPWIETENSHGSGDTLSAAICAYLAQGDSMVDAILQAQKFTAKALQAARHWRLGKGHGPLSHFSQAD